MLKNGRGKPLPYRHREKSLLSATDKTKIYILLFTIKKKHAVASCPRVSTSHLRKTTVCDVALAYNSPKHLREYWFELRTNPISTPTGSSFGSFLSRKEQELFLQLTPHKLILKKFKKAIDKIFRESYNIRVVKIFGGGK